jgi:hypothetical protein
VVTLVQSPTLVRFQDRPHSLLGSLAVRGLRVKTASPAAIPATLPRCDHASALSSNTTAPGRLRCRAILASLKVNVLRHASSVWIQLDRVTFGSVRGGNSVLPVLLDCEPENVLLIPHVELSI